MHFAIPWDVNLIYQFDEFYNFALKNEPKYLFFHFNKKVTNLQPNNLLTLIYRFTKLNIKTNSLLKFNSIKSSKAFEIILKFIGKAIFLVNLFIYRVMLYDPISYAQNILKFISKPCRLQNPYFKEFYA